jgi:hypothetical protein
MPWLPARQFLKIIVASFVIVSCQQSFGAVFWTPNPQGGGLQISHLTVGPTFFSATEPDFQVERTESGLGDSGDGVAYALGGMYSEVRPDIAYIAITNGSRLSLTAPSRIYNESIPPSHYGNNATISRSMSFGGEASNINYIWVFGEDNPTQLYLAMQYSLEGYLAPGATLSYQFNAYAFGNAGRVFAKVQPQFYSQIAESGYFSVEHTELVPFSSLLTYPALSFDLQFSGSVVIQSPEGVGESWVVLDPGAGVFNDSAAPLPWLPAQVAVPEPCTLAITLLMFSGVGVGVAARRSRVPRV